MYALVESVKNDDDNYNDNIYIECNVRETKYREGESFHKDKESSVECRECDILQTVCD